MGRVGFVFVAFADLFFWLCWLDILYGSFSIDAVVCLVLKYSLIIFAFSKI
jgi:hypothetical protein